MSKNIHLMPDHFFSQHFIKTIEKNKLIKNNLFLIYGFDSGGISSGADKLLSDYPGHVFLANSDFGKYIEKMSSSEDKVFIHRLDAAGEKAINYIYGKVKEIGWIYWGEVDKYSRYEERKIFYGDSTLDYIQKNEIEDSSLLKKVLIKSQVFKLREYVRSIKPLRRRKVAIGKIDHFLHWNRIDFDFLIKEYNLKKNYPEFNFFGYGSSAVNDEIMSLQVDSESKINEKKFYKLVVGHSANLSVNHADGFKAVKENITNFDNSLPIDIVCPLAYGDLKYKDFVINLGEALFGDRFKSVTRRLELKDYIKFLNNADCGIFPIKHSAAAGNIFTLLALGKPVFVDDRSPLYKFLKNMSYDVYPISILKEIALSTILNSHCSKNNVEISKKSFNQDKFNQCYKALFS